MEDEDNKKSSDEEEYKISSELYSEYSYVSTAQPTFNKKNVVSKFTFKFPRGPPQVDADGDFVLERKSYKESNLGAIEIEHSQSTVLDLVGLQVWRGALLLGDWLIHTARNFPEDSIILELGSGVGLTSIVAAMFRPVICTDIDKGGLLKLIECNVSRNDKIIKHPITVLELDFMSQVINENLVKTLPKVKVILAADVIYDDFITEAFIKTVNHLLSKPPKRSVYIALEKRYVFTQADFDTVAPCYEYFLRCLDKLENSRAEQMPLDFPQYFHYDRVKELVLWKITSSF